MSSNRTVTLAEVIRQAIDSRLLDVFTCLPGVVNTYNPITQKADIELVSKRPIEDVNGQVTFEEIAILPEVRVCFPSGGGNYMHWPLTAGDGGLVHFSMFDASGWLTTGNAKADPTLVDSHLLQSAFFVPNLTPTSEVVPNAADAVVIVAKDLRLGSNLDANVTELATHADLIALADAISNAANGDAIPAAVSAIKSTLLGSTVKGEKA